MRRGLCPLVVFHRASAVSSLSLNPAYFSYTTAGNSAAEAEVFLGDTDDGGGGKGGGDALPAGVRTAETAASFTSAAAAASFSSAVAVALEEAAVDAVACGESVMFAWPTTRMGEKRSP